MTPENPWKSNNHWRSKPPCFYPSNFGKKIIELDDGNIYIQATPTFDGKTTMVSGEDFSLNQSIEKTCCRFEGRAIASLIPLFFWGHHPAGPTISHADPVATASMLRLGFGKVNGLVSFGFRGNLDRKPHAFDLKKNVFSVNCPNRFYEEVIFFSSSAPLEWNPSETRDSMVSRLMKPHIWDRTMSQKLLHIPPFPLCFSCKAFLW